MALQEQLKQKETLWKQKSYQQWLSSNDLNAKYFHANTVIRRCYNSIDMIKSQDGTWKSDQVDFENMFVNHFLKIYVSSNANLLTDLTNLVPLIFDLVDYTFLCNVLDTPKIKFALFSLGSHKAHGPNGMTKKFFKISWHITCKDIIEAVQNFFHLGHLLKEINHTHIAPIPKNDSSINVSSYHPIRLYNITYKIIQKI